LLKAGPMDKQFPPAALSAGDEVFHHTRSPGVTVAHIRAAAGRVHYGWIVVGISFFVIVATAGVRNAPGVLIVPLEAEFGWSRATISLAIGVNLLLYGAVGPRSQRRRWTALAPGGRCWRR